MKKLSKQELLQIKGGSFTLGKAALIASGIVFLIGAIDGFLRPLRCN